jgi:hypothetical protein
MENVRSRSGTVTAAGAASPADCSLRLAFDLDGFKHKDIVKVASVSLRKWYSSKRSPWHVAVVLVGKVIVIFVSVERKSPHCKRSDTMVGGRHDVLASRCVNVVCKFTSEATCVRK